MACFNTSGVAILRQGAHSPIFLKPSPPLSNSPRHLRPKSSFSTQAKKKAVEEVKPAVVQNPKEEEIAEEEELPWIQDKAMDLVEFTGSVTQALPGPRVGQSSLPWILVVPLAYAGVTFVIAFVRTVRKFNSPKQKRRNLVNKNATLCTSIDELLEKGRDQLQSSDLAGVAQKIGAQSWLYVGSKLMTCLMVC